jgi:hypothetical protein
MGARRGTSATRGVNTRARASNRAFGRLKTIAWIRKVKLRGLAKVDWLFGFASAAYNLMRLPKLLPSRHMRRATCLLSKLLERDRRMPR